MLSADAQFGGNKDVSPDSTVGSSPAKNKLREYLAIVQQLNGRDPDFIIIGIVAFKFIRFCNQIKLAVCRALKERDLLLLSLPDGRYLFRKYSLSGRSTQGQKPGYRGFC